MSVDAALAGGTGLTGSNILHTLAHHTAIRNAYTFARRDVSGELKVTPIVESDSSKWASLLAEEVNKSSGNLVFFSALGTTRAKVGGLANQYKIDHELPVSLATSLAGAKRNGTKVFVLISSASANPKSFMGYSKMKGETEEAAKALVKDGGLDGVVILRPGLICGTRREEDSRAAEFALRKLADFMGSYLGNGFKDFWAQDASVIGRAAVSAGLQCAEGRGERVWVLEQKDIVRLGRTEWDKAQ